MNAPPHAPSVRSTAAAVAKASLEPRLQALEIRLSADAIRGTALSSPLWAVIVSGLFGGLLPELGRTQLSVSAAWVVLCAVVAAAVFVLCRVVKTKLAAGTLDATRWRTPVTAGYCAVALSWCLVTPLFWEPGNTANHCFLLVLAIAPMSLFLASPNGKFAMVLAGTMPNLAMIWIYFLYPDSWFDAVIALVLPVWAAQLHADAWRACRTVREAHRTKLELQILADELSVARDEAGRANRAKSLFLANMSHELRTPLNAILGFSEVIARETLGPEARERYRDYAGDIQRSGRHLLGLINDVLEFARIEAGRLELDPRRLDGAKFLADCVAPFIGPAEAKGIALHMSSEPSEPALFADERAFAKIVNNILANAIRFTPSGGEIEVKLSSNEAGATLSVRDTGCGIPPDQLARLFQPFERLDNEYTNAHGGAGLGLTLVRALSALHGGSAAIASEPGEGTTVSVFLPAQASQIAA